MATIPTAHQDHKGANKVRLSFRSILMAVVVLLGLIAVMYYGVQPRAIAKIKISEFTNLEEASNAIQLRLRQELQMNSVLLIGVESGKTELENLAQTLLLRQMSDPIFNRQTLFIDQDLEQLMPSLSGLVGERLSVQKDKDRLLSALRTANEKKLNVAVVLPAEFAAGMLKDSAAEFLHKNEIKFLSLIFMSLSRNREQEQQTTIPCRVADHDLEGTGSLGCEAIQLARMNYRKKMHAGQWVGLLSQVSATDYLFLINREP